MLNRNIKWIMLVSGVLTCTMLYAAIAPQTMLQSTFGETLDGPLADIIVRNWGALIVLIGGMLIYGAFKPAVRSLVLVVAAASKLVYIALVLSKGGQYASGQAAVSIAIDTVMVVLFAAHLVLAQPGDQLDSANGRSTRHGP